MNKKTPEQSIPLHFDVSIFALQVRTKRGNRGLREVAREIGGISASTLLRIETEHSVDLRTVSKVCEWLGLPPDDFFSHKAKGLPDPLTTYQQIEMLLRSETQLKEQEISSIMTLIIALDCYE
jgi:transcriptional regulator with XRE-family HTH domain